MGSPLSSAGTDTKEDLDHDGVSLCDAAQVCLSGGDLSVLSLCSCPIVRGGQAGTFESDFIGPGEDVARTDVATLVVDNRLSLLPHCRRGLSSPSAIIRSKISMQQPHSSTVAHVLGAATFEVPGQVSMTRLSKSRLILFLSSNDASFIARLKTTAFVLSSRSLLAPIRITSLSLFAPSITGR